MSDPPNARSSQWQDRALRALAVLLVAGVVLGVVSWWRTRMVAKAPAISVVVPSGGARGQAAPRTVTGDGALELSGYVVDGAGTPVADVEVAAEHVAAGPAPGAADDEDGPGFSTTPVVASPTNTDGSFTLRGVDAGWHRVRVSGAGIFTSVVTGVSVPGDPLTVVVARKTSIVGRVVERGQPVVGATVHVTSDVIGGTVELRSGPGGAFSLPVLPEGSYRALAFRGDTASAAAVLLRLGPGPFPLLELALERAALLRGRVIELPQAAGASAVGVVAAIELRPLGDDEPPRYAQSGADGRFLIEGVHLGRWVVSAVAPGYVLPAPVEVDVGVGDVEIAVVAGGAIEGRVLDGAGRPVAGVALRAQAQGSARELSGEREEALLASMGGRALVAAAAWEPERAAKTDPRFVPRGELGVLLGPIPLIPPPGARAARRGAFDPAELPPELAALARPPTFAIPPAARSQWTSDSEGRFALRGLSPGRYTISARSPSHAEGRRGPIAVAAGRAQRGVDVVISAGTILSGVVRDVRGAPVIGARIVATSAATAPAETRSGGDGSYRLPPLAGVVKLEVSADGHATTSRRVDAGQVAGSIAAERREDFALTVYDAVLRGVADDARGAPLAGARITVSAGPAAGRSAIAGPDGAFVLERLPPGPLRLTVEHPDVPAHHAAADPARVARLSAPFGGGVEGRVVDDAGLPMINVRVAAAGPSGATAEDSTERDGGFRFRALRAGEWKLSASRTGLRPATRAVTVVAGAARDAATVRDVVLVLARGATVGGTVRDARGGRVADARVVVRGRDGATAEGRTDARGEFRVRDCPTGELELVVEHALGAARAQVFLRPGQEVVSLALELSPP